MIKRYRVLIADKNPRIRRFLKREFTTAGYLVSLAENSEQVLKFLYGPTRLDLLIIDPDFPDADVAHLSKKLDDRVPQIPVILHSLDTDSNCTGAPLRPVQWVEKNGCSVEKLKRAVAGILAKSVPSSAK